MRDSDSESHYIIVHIISVADSKISFVYFLHPHVFVKSERFIITVYIQVHFARCGMYGAQNETYIED